MSGPPSLPSVRDVWICPYTLHPRAEADSWNARAPARPLRGFLVRSGNGFGCVQPWPEFGDATVEALLESIRSDCPDPLVVRALECAEVDGAARATGRSLFEGLNIPLSHALVTRTADFPALRTAGFTVCKLKGGADLQAVVRSVRAAAAAGLRVRVDFNGVLTIAGASAFLREVSDLRDFLEFVEDPVQWNAWDWRRLEGEYGVPLALDLSGESSPQWGLRVVKPARMHVPADAETLIFTSAMDHPVGQMFAAWEAARYPGRQGLAGLLTHRLFTEDAFTGRLGGEGPDLQPPGGTGLGFDDLLERLPWRSAANRSHRVHWNPKARLPGPAPAVPAGCEGFATSGSGGVPRIVVLTRRALETSAQSAAAFLGLSSGDVWLRILPDFHVAGYQILTRAAMTGSRVVTDDGRWNPGRFREICDREAVTATSLVPAQVHDLTLAGIPAPSPLRILLVGGGAIPEATRLAARALGWPVRVSYGMTETGSFIAAATHPDTVDLTLLPGWEARIPQPDGAGAGVLELSGPSICLGWHAWNGGEWEWTPVPADGWLRTADRATVKGRVLQIRGRADRVVKILGELVDLDSVESQLAMAGLPAGSFAVVAVPDARAGSRLLLACEGEVSADVLERYHRGTPPFAGISAVEAGIALPRSGLGKIMRGRLADSLQERIRSRQVPG